MIKFYYDIPITTEFECSAVSETHLHNLFKTGKIGFDNGLVLINAELMCHIVYTAVEFFGEETSQTLEPTIITPDGKEIQNFNYNYALWDGQSVNFQTYLEVTTKHNPQLLRHYDRIMMLKKNFFNLPEFRDSIKDAIYEIHPIRQFPIFENKSVVPISITDEDLTIMISLS